MSKKERYIATYGTGIFERERTSLPQVYQYFKYKDSLVTFILPDRVQVKLVTAPDPEMVGMEGCWGELREKTHWDKVRERLQKTIEKEQSISYSVREKVDFWVEILEERPYWLCYPPAIKNKIKELHDKVSARNRQIEGFRK